MARLLRRPHRASETRRGPRISIRSTIWCISISRHSTRYRATRSPCSGSRSAAGSPPRSPRRAAIGSISSSSSIRSASRSATARHRTSSTSSTDRPTKCAAPAGTTRIVSLPILTRCRTRRWSSMPAIARHCASMPGTPTCTIRNCRAGSAGSRCRPCWCGGRATGWSARITAVPIAG